MKYIWLVVGIVAIAVLGFYALSQPSEKFVPVAQEEVKGDTITAENVLILTNNSRIEAKRVPLKLSTTLSQIAQEKAEDMARRDYLEHLNPEGQKIYTKLRAINYKYRLAGENLARGFESMQRLHNSWMSSPTHKKNIVEPRFREIGIGIATGTHNGTVTTYVVQLFTSGRR